MYAELNFRCRAEIGGLKLKEINALEREFLSALEYNLFVRSGDYDRSVRHLLAVTSHLATEWPALDSVGAAECIPPKTRPRQIAAAHSTSSHDGATQDRTARAVKSEAVAADANDQVVVPLEDKQNSLPSKQLEDLRCWTAVTAGRDVAGALLGGGGTAADVINRVCAPVF